MTKRFTIRKLKKHSYSRQGWKLKDCGYTFAIYDREWEKRVPSYICGVRQDFSEFKYIEDSSNKEVAEFWAKWLNENKADCYNRMINIPMNIFNEGLKLYSNSKEA